MIDCELSERRAGRRHGRWMVKLHVECVIATTSPFVAVVCTQSGQHAGTVICPRSFSLRSNRLGSLSLCVAFCVMHRGIFTLKLRNPSTEIVESLPTPRRLASLEEPRRLHHRAPVSARGR